MGRSDKTNKEVMEKRKKKRKAVRKYERKDTSVKNRRTAEIMKRNIVTGKQIGRAHV